MECKNCGCTEFYKEMKGPHLGVYCKACGSWQKWEKHTDNPKTKEEYKAEYLDKQPATPEQIYYIKNLQKGGISKFQAMKIIEILRGEAI
jgi:hypothetical protein